MKTLCAFLVGTCLYSGLVAQTIREIEVGVKGPAEFIVLDSLDRKTGYDPLSETRFQEIPYSGYGNEGTDSEDPNTPAVVWSVCTINQPFSGWFRIQVMGADTGSYLLLIRLHRIVDGNDSGRNFQFRAVTTRGHLDEYRIYYDLDPTRLLFAEETQKVSSYSLFATHSLWLEQNSSVFSGDLGVNEAGSPPFLNSEVELAIGIGTSLAPGYSVKANHIKVKQGATVASDVYYNTLHNNGTITGSLHTPLSLPLVANLPEFKAASPGTQDITVPQNGSQALQPGSYRDVIVKKSGVLTFTGGVYHLNSFNGGDNVKLLFQGPSEVRIAGKFDTDQGAYLGPRDTTTLSASQIVFYVAGINGSNGNLGTTPKAAQIGIANTVRANFYVPNGTLWIRQNSQATGAFIGKDVDVGRGVTIWLKSAF